VDHARPLRTPRAILQRRPRVRQPNEWEAILAAEGLHSGIKKLLARIDDNLGSGIADIQIMSGKFARALERIQNPGLAQTVKKTPKQKTSRPWDGFSRRGSWHPTQLSVPEETEFRAPKVIELAMRTGKAGKQPENWAEMQNAVLDFSGREAHHPRGEEHRVLRVFANPDTSYEDVLLRIAQ